MTSLYCTPRIHSFSSDLAALHYWRGLDCAALVQCGFRSTATTVPLPSSEAILLFPIWQLDLWSSMLWSRKSADILDAVGDVKTISLRVGSRTDTHGLSLNEGLWGSPHRYTFAVERPGLSSDTSEPSRCIAGDHRAANVAFPKNPCIASTNVVASLVDIPHPGPRNS